MRIEVSVQGLSLDEAFALDEDLDGHLAAEEFAARQAEIGAYFVDRLRLLTDRGDGEEELLPAVYDGLAPTEAAPGLPDAYEWFVVRLHVPLAAPLDEFALEHLLFLDTNPEHSDYTRVTWEGGATREVLFGGGWQRERFRSDSGRRRLRVLGGFVGLGIHHILSGYDHLGFLLALLVASRRLKSMALVVTAFTLAHSLTLGLAALDVVSVPSRFVELAIALSIAYVACENLLRREARTPWVEAFGFGLLHGLGFASVLGDSLAGEPLVLTALGGFNVGVELGQLGVVVAIVLAARLVFRRTAPGAGMFPDRAALALSAGVALLGFYWFFERAGWLPA